MATFLLIGPGAIGGFVAAKAIEAGHECWVACRTQSTADALTTGGLVATDAKGKTIRVPVKALCGPRPLSVDVVLLATKCRSAVDAWKSWAPHVPPRATLVALQNGIMGDALLPYAEERLVLATVAYPARLEGVGRTRQIAPGAYHIGTWPPEGLERHVQAAAELLLCSGKVHLVDNMEGVQWTKLLINSAMTGLGILTGKPVGETLADRRARDAVGRLMAEGVAAGEANGVEFARVAGFHPTMLAEGRSPWPKWIRHQMLKLYGRKYGDHESSSLPDLQKGLPTEVEFLNGHVAQAGHAQGVATPTHDALLAAVARIEAGEISPSPALLDHLA